MKKLTVSVEQRHIEKGQRRNCYFCPIALAIQEQVNAQIVEVNCRYVKINHVIKRILPKIASDFIQNFDHKADAVTPFTFKINYVGRAI